MTIVETMDRGERGMNPVTMTIISPRKECWLCLWLNSDLLFSSIPEPHSSFGGVSDLRTGGCWFDPWLGQYTFGGLMIVIATGFIPLSPLSVLSTEVMWESSQWLGKNIVQSTG